MDLWTEFDDEHFPAEPTRSGRTRKITEQVVLSALRGWLLSDYVASFCRSLGATRIYRRCYWIDGLGGNHMLQPALSTSQELAKENRSIVLHYIALESKSSKRKVANGKRPGRQAPSIHHLCP